MEPEVFSALLRRRFSGRFGFAALADRARMPWRFLARHVTVDGLRAA